jgi:hypothetical protein
MVDLFFENKYKFVKSKYKSRWKGVIIDKQHRTGFDDLYLVLVLKDKNGNVPRKRTIKRIADNWTEEINKFDISNINKDWFKRLPEL